MKRTLAYLVASVAFAGMFINAREGDAAQWLISDLDNLYDYTQGSGNAGNSRSVTQSANGFLTGIDYSANGTLFALTAVAGGGNLYSINPMNGNSTLIGPTTGLHNLSNGDIGFDPTSGILYGISNFSFSFQYQLFTLNTATGAASVVGNIPVGTISPGVDAPTGLAFDNSGQMWMILENQSSSGIGQLLQVDKTNASIQSAKNIGVSFFHVNGLIGADFDPTTNQLYFAAGTGTGGFYSVNTSTGTATLLGTHGVTLATGLAFVPVPEPQGLVLVMLGSTLLLWCRGRRLG